MLSLWTILKKAKKQIPQIQQVKEQNGTKNNIRQSCDKSAYIQSTN